MTDDNDGHNDGDDEHDSTDWDNDDWHHVYFETFTDVPSSNSAWINVYKAFISLVLCGSDLPDRKPGSYLQFKVTELQLPSVKQVE